MEREQFKILCKGMKAVYTQETFLPDADAFNVWFGLLGDLDYAVLNAAIQKYMLTNKFPPTMLNDTPKIVHCSTKNKQNKT